MGLEGVSAVRVNREQPGALAQGCGLSRITQDLAVTVRNVALTVPDRKSLKGCEWRGDIR